MVLRVYTTNLNSDHSKSVLLPQSPSYLPQIRWTKSEPNAILTFGGNKRARQNSFYCLLKLKVTEFSSLMSTPTGPSWQSGGLGNPPLCQLKCHFCVSIPSCLRGFLVYGSYFGFGPFSSLIIIVPTPTSPSRHCFQNVTLSASSDPSESVLFSRSHPQRFKMSPSVPTPTRPSRHCFQNFTPSIASD